VLPVLIFVIAIGVITWFVQDLPGRANKRTVNIPKGPRTNPLQFEVKQAIWDPKDQNYVAEFEYRAKGHYDFPFRNTTDSPAELCLYRKSCTCSRVEYALKPTDSWQPLPETPEEEGKGVVVVPARAEGVVRLLWEGRKQEGERLNLTADLWVQPQGKPGERSYDTKLAANISFVPPVRHFPEMNPEVVLLTTRDVAQREFFLWSATRDKVEVTIREKQPDPCLTCEVTPLSADDGQRLRQDLLKEVADLTPEQLHQLLKGIAGLTPEQLLQRYLARFQISTRVRTAFRVTVTVHEQKDGKQIDLGPFRRRLYLCVAGEAREYLGPTVQGAVRGEVLVGAPEDQGKVDLKSFTAADGARKKVLLWTDRGVDLEKESHHPAFLQVKLEKDEKNATDSRMAWWLTVVVPAGAHAGPLPPESAVVLHTRTTPPRRVHVPVVGNAGRR
jgi:hypothetical protein